MNNLEPDTHDWRIDPREYERHEERRGRRHAFEHLDPVRTALIVIDMVPFFVEQNSYARGIVPNIMLLADTLRARGGCVAWVLPAATPASSTRDEFYGTEVAERYRRSGGSGPLDTRLWHEFGAQPSDVMIEKSSPSAFFPGGSALPSVLGERGVDTVLITGTVANVCCESSARDASALDNRVVMVADANAARTDAELNATLHTIYRSFGDVRSTADVVELISGEPASGLG